MSARDLSLGQQYLHKSQSGLWVPAGGVGTLVKVFTSPLLNNLKGYWPLNDSQTNLQNGTISALHSDATYTFNAPNTALLSAAGIAGLSPCADYGTHSSSQPLIYSTNAGLQPVSNQQFTLNGWINPTSTTFANIFGNYGTAGSGFAGGTGIMVNTGPATIYATDGSGTDHHQDWGSSLSTSAWSMVTGGWDGSNLWIQVNAGTRINQALATVHSVSNPLCLGNFPSSSTLHFPLIGLLAGCSYWWRSLSASEVTTLYASGAPVADQFR